VYTTLKNGVAAMLLIGLAALVTPRAEVRSIGHRSWLWLVVIGIVGGSIPFLLFFGGLAVASAPTAAFIHKTLFIWVAVMAVPLLGERLGWYPIAAMGVLLVGQALVAPPTGVAWGTGETMIAIATLFWAAEVVIARRLLLGTVSSPLLGAARLGIGLMVLVGYLAITGRLSMIGNLTATQWAWAVGTGALLAGYVATWFAALQRAPASVVASVLVVAAPITAVLQSAANGTTPTWAVLIGQALITTGVAVIALLAIGSARRPARAVS
jgi:drug/metabolite transporter (DMT)-like permease